MYFFHISEKMWILSHLISAINVVSVLTGVWKATAFPQENIRLQSSAAAEWWSAPHVAVLLHPSPAPSPRTFLHGSHQEFSLTLKGGCLRTLPQCGPWNNSCARINEIKEAKNVESFNFHIIKRALKGIAYKQLFVFTLWYIVLTFWKAQKCLLDLILELPEQCLFFI